MREEITGSAPNKTQNSVSKCEKMESHKRHKIMCRMMETWIISVSTQMKMYANAFFETKSFEKADAYMDLKNSICYNKYAINMTKIGRQSKCAPQALGNGLLCRRKSIYATEAVGTGEEKACGENSDRHCVQL